MPNAKCQKPNTKWNVTKCLHGWNYDRSANKRAGYGNNDTHWLIVYNTCPQVQDATTHPQRHVSRNILRSEYANTLVTELDLVCDYAQWPHISTSLFYVGSLLGNIIFGNIADRFRILGVIKDTVKSVITSQSSVHYMKSTNKSWHGSDFLAMTRLCKAPFTKTHPYNRFGRLTAFFLLLFMATSLGVAIAFAPNYTVFTILR